MRHTENHIGFIRLLSPTPPEENPKVEYGLLVELVLWPAGARHTVPLAPWLLFLLAQGGSLVPWQPVRHPGMGNQAAAQILETITANYQACRFPIVCLHSTRNQGAGDEDVGGSFQFWLAERLVLSGGWAPSCLETHKAPIPFCLSRFQNARPPYRIIDLGSSRVLGRWGGGTQGHKAKPTSRL